MNSFRGFVRKEIFHILRDRKTLAVLVLLPVVAVLLFGFAIRTDVEEVRLAIVDPAPDPSTLELRGEFEGTGIFEIVNTSTDARELDRLFQASEIQQAIVFERGFAARLSRPEGASLQIITDATDPNTGSAIEAYSSAIIGRYQQRVAARGPGGRIVPESRMRFNPTMESTNLFVPGLIAFVLTIVAALMTAISITREKETGTMEVLLVSPLRPLEIIVGKVLPYLALGFFNAITVLVLAYLVFGVPVRGNLLLLLGECLLYVLTALSLGVMISTRTDSQRVAMTAALAGLLMPTLMLSGFIFPIESMPAVLRAVSHIIPARWFLEIVRGIMLKGAGLGVLWQETAVLAAMTLVLLAASVKNFKIRLA